MGRVAPVIDLNDKDRETLSSWTRAGRTEQRLVIDQLLEFVFDHLPPMRLSVNYSTARGVLILLPSTPVIAPSDHRQLAS